jgi:hypothetical protein
VRAAFPLFVLFFFFFFAELSYEHEDFAKVLVKSHHAKILVKMAHSGQEKVVGS